MARAETAVDRARPVRWTDLVGLVWRLFSSTQFAVALLGFLALAALLATVLPQVPVSIRDNPAAIDVWVDSRSGTFGPFTEPMQRVGLFNIVRSWWFLAALGLLALSVCVYTVDRFAATWSNVARPRRQVPDSFFERAANRLALPASGPETAGRLAALLRRRRYDVQVTQGEGATYLFADRFGWAQLGNLVTHGALVLFLVGGLLSYTRGYTNALLIPEGGSNPVFAVSHPEQMQVEVVDTSASFAQDGTAVDYRSELVIYQGGEAVAQGETTVNDPLTYNGYRFHQAGFLGEGAALRVRDVETGNTLFREALPLDDLTAAPAVVVRDESGAVLLDDVIVPTDSVREVGGTLISLPGTERQFWVGIGQRAGEGWRMVVFDPEQGESGGFDLAERESLSSDGLEWTFAEAAGLPSALAGGIPGAPPMASVMMSDTPEGELFVTVLPVEGRALTLYEGQPVELNGRAYEFEGRREFSGIEVRKDPGVNFIWAAAGLLLLGLLVTFYVPRMRLWARVRDDETVIASIAERAGVFQSEMKHLIRSLGDDRIESEDPKDDA